MVIPQKLPVNNFESIQDTSQFNEDFIRNYNEESDEGYCLEIDVKYPKKLHEIHKLNEKFSEKMKIEKFGKLVPYLIDKSEYVVHIRNLKQALESWISFDKITHNY